MSERHGTEMTVKPSELFDILVWAIPLGLRILIAGSPGGGKTSVVKQAVAWLKMVLRITHPVLHTPSTYEGLGYPVKDKDGNATHASFLAFGMLQEVCTTDKPTVLAIDDLGQAVKLTQGALMQIIEERSINDHKLSDSVTVIAMTNRRKDKAGVGEFNSALKERFDIILNLVNDRDDLADHLNRMQYPPECSAFIRSEWNNGLSEWKAIAEPTRKSCSPRTLEHLFKCHKNNPPMTLRRKIFAGAIDTEIADKWIGFLEVWEGLIDYRDIVNNPMGCNTPTSLATTYMTVGMLASNATFADIDQVMQYVERMAHTTGIGWEYVSLFIADLKNRKNDALSSSAVTNFIQKYSKELGL